MNPLVTVLVPAYNHEAFVGETLDSLTTQDHQHIEILVIDDASTDRTAGIVARYAARDDRIQLIRSEHNRGIPTNWNRVLDRAQGDYLVAGSSDDLWPVDAFSKRLAFLEEHPECDVVVTDFDVITPRGTFSGADKFQVTPQFEALANINFRQLFQTLLLGNFIPGGSVMMRRSAIDDRALRQDALCPNLSDYDLWCRLAMKHEWRYLPESTWTYRWHGANLSHPAHPKHQRAVVKSQQLYVLTKLLLEPEALLHQGEILSALQNHTLRLQEILRQPSPPFEAHRREEILKAHAHQLRALKRRRVSLSKMASLTGIPRSTLMAFFEHKKG